MDYNILINELTDLLDQNEDIKKIKLLKSELINDNNLLNDINNYRLDSNINNKKKLYNNQKYVDKRHKNKV